MIYCTKCKNTIEDVQVTHIDYDTDNIFCNMCHSLLELIDIWKNFPTIWNFEYVFLDNLTKRKLDDII